MWYPWPWCAHLTLRFAGNNCSACPFQQRMLEQRFDSRPWKQPSPMMHTASQGKAGHSGVLVQMLQRKPVGPCLRAVKCTQSSVTIKQILNRHTPGVCYRTAALASILHCAMWELKSSVSCQHLLPSLQDQEWTHWQPGGAQSGVIRCTSHNWRGNNVKWSTYLLLWLGMIQHNICWTPPNFHIKEKVQWSLAIAHLDALEEFLSLWQRVSLCTH